jgi:hypothetical protein
MKKLGLTKDQLQKMILSVLGFIALLYVYFTFFLGPLNRSRNTMLGSIKELETTINTSKLEITRVANLERQAKNATKRLGDLKSLCPEGAPIAWFPPRMKSFFTNDQIDKVVARLEGSNDAKESDLAEWTRYNWLISLPETDYRTLGRAIADLENTEPLLAINRMTIHTLPSQPGIQQVEVAAANLIPRK